jgi:hypothetical protein
VAIARVNAICEVIAVFPPNVREDLARAAVVAVVQAFEVK